MCMPSKSGSVQPLAVSVASVFGDDCTRNDVIMWTLQWTAEHDEDVKVVFGGKRLALVVEHPNSLRQLVGFALDGYRAARFCIGGKYINAAGVAEGDGSNVSSSG